MKRFLKTPAFLAFLASWALGSVAHAQLNTESYFAELNQQDRYDVVVQAGYTPFGNKTALNRYGDDGSAAMVEASGLILWRTSDGVYRPLPDTIYSKPLFVSNSECVVWLNAYDPTIAEEPEVQQIRISYFRINSSTGDLIRSDMSVQGNKILDTPSITTTTAPYTLVTANVADMPPVTNTHEDKNLFVYRLTHTSTTPQLLSTNAWSSNEYLTHGAETVAVSADGSQVVRIRDSNIVSQIPELIDTLYVWVRNNGVVKPLFRASDAFSVAAVAAGYLVSNMGTGDAIVFTEGETTGNSYPIIRPVEVSAARFVFGPNRYDLNVAETPNFLYNYSRDPVADHIQVQNTIDLGVPGEVIPLPNFSQQGVLPVFVTQDDVGTLNVFRLVGNLSTFLYAATLPQPLGMDVAVTRINATFGSESIALRDATNQGVVWLHNGPGSNLATDSPLLISTTNFSIIDEIWGHPLFVTPGEVIVWANALAPVLPNGALQPVVVKHYGRDAATGEIITTDVKVLADATDPNAIYPGALRGTQVFAPSPFTQDPELWKLETGEKLATNVLRVRRYQLLTPLNADEDGDGIRGGLEEGPFYVIPGTFTYAQAVEDASRRGGRLATFTDAAEFARMQLALTLWQLDSAVDQIKPDVPYPLWIGLELNPGWQWSDGTPGGFIATKWAVGEPSAVFNRTRGRLTPSQQFEASNPAIGGSYLLELTPTDRLAKDTDGDGASDYDELFRLITNPVVPNFTSPPGPPVTIPFGSALVNGSYEGFLTEFGRGPVASFTLSVSKKGGYTGKINGAPGSASIRGNFASDGSVTALPVNLGNGLSTTLSMWIGTDPVSGIYRVGGRLVGLSGNPLVFELRRAGYGRSFATPDAGDYTIAIPSSSVPKVGLPNGDGYLFGTIGRDGRTKLRGSTSEGLSLSWSGNLLEGDLLSFFSTINRSAGFIGSNLFLRDTAVVDAIYGLVGESDIDGDLLVVLKPVTSGSGQIAGYSFRSGAYGSLYQRISYNQLPSFSDFLVKPDNTVITFIDGAFSGQNVIASWSTKNAITIPKTQTRTLNAKINVKTGELRGSYRYNDPTSGYAESNGTLGGVVLQKSGEVRGYYKAGTASGQLVLLPNLGGTQAPVTMISPRSKTGISEDGATYKIYVTASEPWRVINPASDWVIVQPSSGTGNAELIVTVSGNSTNLRRKADLTIAGINHHIEQEWNRQAGGTTVTIAPAAQSVSALGSSYSVQITGLTTLNASDFVSNVPWVVVTPAADLRSATVVVSEYITPGFDPRSTVITIAGQSHTIVQSAWYYWY